MANVAVVTGGTAGIGLACADRFASEGWNVAVIARDANRLAETEARLKARGVEVIAIEADVADAAAMHKAADRVYAAWGRIDAWVNNAMATIVSPAHKVTPEEYRRVTDVTYLGTVNGTLAALKHMRTRNKGAIVGVNSVLGIRPFPLQVPYSAAKAAAAGFANGLRSELLKEGCGVTLSTVFLPAVNTPQFSGWARNRTGRRQIAPDPVYDPHLCANAVWFAVAHPRRDIWVGRTAVLASLLQRIWPNAGDFQAKNGWQAQLSDERFPENEGNLFKPAPGPARLHGPFNERMSGARHAFVTSRQRDVAVLGGIGLAVAHAAWFTGRWLNRRRR